MWLSNRQEQHCDHSTDKNSNVTGMVTMDSNVETVTSFAASAESLSYSVENIMTFWAQGIADIAIRFRLIDSTFMNSDIKAVNATPNSGKKISFIPAAI